MNIGFGQILIIIFVGILLFGNFPSLLKDLAIGIKNFRETLKLSDKESHKDNDSQATSRQSKVTYK